LLVGFRLHARFLLVAPVDFFLRAGYRLLESLNFVFGARACDALFG
jgi:hypothetical protein